MGQFLKYDPIEISHSLGLGPFGLEIDHDSGVVLRSGISVGFGHKGVGKILQTLPLPICLSYVEQIDHQAPNVYSLGLSICFEELMGLEVSERAKAIRVLVGRVMLMRSHLGYLYRIARIGGQAALAQHCLRERERFHDLMEMLCGSRAGFGAICVGGVFSDATDGWLFKLEKAMNSLEVFLPEYIESLLEQPIFASRVRGLGVVSADVARKHELSGANLRATGIDPNGIYYGLVFTNFINRNRRQMITFGDAYSRIWARVLEIEGAIGAARAEALQLPAGNFCTKVALGAQLGVGHAACELEGPRGNVFISVDKEEGSGEKSVSFFNGSRATLSVLQRATVGIELDDLPLTIASFDPAISEVDL